MLLTRQLLVWIHVRRKPRVKIKQVMFFPGKYNKSSEKQRGWWYTQMSTIMGHAIKLPKKGKGRHKGSEEKDKGRINEL